MIGRQMSKGKRLHPRQPSIPSQVSTAQENVRSQLHNQAGAAGGFRRWLERTS